MDVVSQIDIKPIYRVTGTPENFLTALRYFTWGFNNQTDWRRLYPGDLIFFHCKGSDSKFLKSSTPSVVGMGIVGTNFFEDATPLWIDEKLEGKTYPFRFSFSEICMFSHVPINDDWDSTTLQKEDPTRQILRRFLDNAIPLSELDGFPHMGSYSKINDLSVRKHLLSLPRQLAFYKEREFSDVLFRSSSELKEIGKIQEALRFSTSLTIFDDIQKKIINKTSFRKEYSTETLQIAESRHFDIIAHLTNVFREKGYEVYMNNHIDLFVHTKTNALLVEAKSTENNNFVAQSRKGLAQLFEYNYFDLANFRREKEISFLSETSLLATSQRPIHTEYVKFVNSLKIKTIAVRDNAVSQYGDSIDLYSL
jgi:hypothetical protein